VKILQLIATKSGIRASSGSPNGGLESVILNLHEAFQNAGWDSHYSDSVGSNSDASIRYDLEKYNYEMYANTVRSWVEREKPDLVIAHGTNTLLKYLTERGIRVLFVEHSMATSINLNSYGALFGYVAPNARTIGSKIITVSPITMTTKKKAIAEFGVDFEFDGWCRFQFPTKELLSRPIEKSEGYCVTIARCEEKKALMRMTNHCIKNNFDWRLVTSLPTQASEEFFAKWLSKYDQTRISKNIPREQTLDILTRGAILGSSSPFESAGVTAFEGLMFGLPLLLNEPPSHDNIHASRMFLPNDDFVSTLRGDQKKTEKLMNLSLSERKNLRDLTISYNPVDSVLASLESFAESIGNPLTEITLNPLERLIAS
jgi:hypothetical protein